MDDKPLADGELLKRIKVKYAGTDELPVAMAAYTLYQQVINGKKHQTKKPSELSTTEKMIASLKLGIKLDHIKYVEHGIRPMDENYHRFKREVIDSKTNS